MVLRVVGSSPISHPSPGWQPFAANFYLEHFLRFCSHLSSIFTVDRTLLVFRLQAVLSAVKVAVQSFVNSCYEGNKPFVKSLFLIQ